MISHIVAVSENGIIGIDGDLPWSLPEDLKRFKQLTSNRVVIMGRKTHESIGRPLPNRVNIVITRQVDYRSSGCLVAASLKDALKVSEFTDDEIFIIGGGEIYKQSMDLVDTIYMTVVNQHITEAENTTYYPDIPSGFEVVSHVNNATHSYITYRRRGGKEA